MVFLLTPDSAPKDLICSICMSVPLKPCSLRTCQHVFCEDCIHENQNHNDMTCPVDRAQYQSSDIELFEEGSLAFRIWSSILIKCDHCEAGCRWTGSIADYVNHQDNCDQIRKERLMESLKAENEALTGRLEEKSSQVKTLEAEKEDLAGKLEEKNSEATNFRSQTESLKAELGMAKEESTAFLSALEVLTTRTLHANLKAENEDLTSWLNKKKNGPSQDEDDERLTRKLEAIKAESTALTLAAQALTREHIRKRKRNDEQTKLPTVKEDYAYDRYDVVELTQLICHDLENKPQNIDANKIFNCATNIYSDFHQMCKGSHPMHFYMDVRLLVSVCLASTWFTDDQYKNLRGFALEQGWD